MPKLSDPDEELIVKAGGHTVHGNLVAFLCPFCMVCHGIAQLPAPTWLGSSAGFASLHL